MFLLAGKGGIDGIVVLVIGLLESFNDELGYDSFSGSWTRDQQRKRFPLQLL